MWHVYAKTESGFHKHFMRKEKVSYPTSVHKSDLMERGYISYPGQKFLYNMGSVLSTPYCAYSRVIAYQCNNSAHFEDIDYLLNFSPILSSVYDPAKIITIEDSDSD